MWNTQDGREEWVLNLDAAAKEGTRSLAMLTSDNMGALDGKNAKSFQPQYKNKTTEH